MNLFNNNVIPLTRSSITCDSTSRTSSFPILANICDETDNTKSPARIACVSKQRKSTFSQ